MDVWLFGVVCVVFLVAIWLQQYNNTRYHIEVGQVPTLSSPYLECNWVHFSLIYNRGTFYSVCWETGWQLRTLYAVYSIVPSKRYQKQCKFARPGFGLGVSVLFYKLCFYCCNRRLGMCRSLCLCKTELRFKLCLSAPKYIRAFQLL